MSKVYLYICIKKKNLSKKENENNVYKKLFDKKVAVVETICLKIINFEIKIKTNR